MGYRLEAAEPIPEGIRRIMLELIDETTANLGDAEADQDKAVHSARKKLKRIRAVLRLVRDEIGEARYQAENICFRDAARRLAGARDSFVMVETVDDLADRYAAELAPDAFDPTRAQLMARYQAVRRQLLEKGDAVEKVLGTLGQARLRLRDLPVDGDDFDVFAGGLRRVYRRGRRRMALAYAVGDDPELFHDWRKRVKYLWHQSEILGPAWPSQLEQQAEALHTLSGYLGEDHDLAELNRVIRLESHRFIGDFSLPILLRLIERRRDALQALARPLGRRLYVEKPGAFVARMEGYWRIWEDESAEARGAAISE
jgi:CHAD domain-containing protein